MNEEQVPPVPIDKEAAMRKHFETHHTREMVRDPVTGKLVNSPAEFEAPKPALATKTTEEVSNANP